MGVYLSSPDVKKDSCDGQSPDGLIRYGSSCMQGWRMSMEDAHITDPEYGKEESLFGVFDGHGGSEVAIFCEKYFGKELKKNPNYLAGKYNEALKETF